MSGSVDIIERLSSANAFEHREVVATCTQGPKIGTRTARLRYVDRDIHHDYEIPVDPDYLGIAYKIVNPSSRLLLPAIIQVTVPEDYDSSHQQRVGEMLGQEFSALFLPDSHILRAFKTAFDADAQRHLLESLLRKQASISDDGRPETGLVLGVLRGCVLSMENVANRAQREAPWPPVMDLPANPTETQ